MVALEEIRVEALHQQQQEITPMHSAGVEGRGPTATEETQFGAGAEVVVMVLRQLEVRAVLRFLVDPQAVLGVGLVIPTLEYSIQVAQAEQ